MQKIIMLKGLPASGKTTWAKEKISKDGNYFRVNKDIIRSEIIGNWSLKKEKTVISIRNTLIKAGLSMGKNVIVDDTNLNPKHEQYLKNLASELGVGFEINDSFLKISPEECVERDMKRENPVGYKVIYKMYYDYICPNPVKRMNTASKKRRCVICDIDGTLAHNFGGRNIYDYTRVIEDTPDPMVCAVIDGLDSTFGVDYLDIILVSGREDNCREQTEEWLEHNMIPYKQLYMRKTGDKRDDTIVKEEIFKEFIEPEYIVLGVIDDRNKVVRMWERLGLKVMKVGGLYDEF